MSKNPRKKFKSNFEEFLQEEESSDLNNNKISSNNNFNEELFESNSTIDRNVCICLLRFNFLNFLKNVKLSIHNKLFLINDYIFIIKHSFNEFIRILKLKVKCAELKRKVKSFQCRKFFKYTRQEISLIKNPNGNKVTTATAYLFHFNKLKEKFIYGLKLNIQINKQNYRKTLLLFGIRNKISILYMYQEMKKIHNNSECAIKKKIRIFIYKNVFNELKYNKNRRNEIDEGFRLIRRYQYINIIKNIVSKFSVQNLRKIKGDKKYKVLNKITKKFLLKKTMKNLKKYINDKYKYNIIEKKVIDKTKFNFIQRVRKNLSNKVIINRHLNFLCTTIKRVMKKKNFMVLYKNIMKYYLNIKKLTGIFYKEIFINKLKLNLALEKEINLKKFKLMRKIRKNGIKQKFINFKEKINIYKEYKNKTNSAYIFYRQMHLKKFIKSLKENRKRHVHKRIMLYEGNKIYEKYTKKEILKKWKIYITIKHKNKNEYLYVENKRNEIISRHLIQELIITSSKIKRLKEDEISNNFINKSSKSVKLALTFFNKLKSIVLLKKKSNLITFNQSPITNIVDNKITFNNDIINNNSYATKKNEKKDDDFLTDLNLLQNIRNKQRSKPMILDINNL